ncbi:sugar nucleotide-binding protein [Arenibacter certesii]|uniref:dTDP-4-dehydrorhamnose reductase n=1 Tax=Arenibacter certesii TaxID=228955 RepID=A0A918IUR0_9FLAO|nr:sugar nucleotide-binding protein [Arenibacter certesii]GGW32885.1 NAD(P)-dependent oxidoreductase [Arenibacter certesii]
MNKILILGASGFIGNAIYRELNSYFDTYGTYYSARRSFENNHQFHRYDLEEDDIVRILDRIKPDLIISAVRGNFQAQVIAHQHIIEYILKNNSKLFFISSANVFDAYSKFPSYEYDKTFSESIYGRLKIKIENMLLRIPKSQMAILRVPMVFGSNSPRIKSIKNSLEVNEPLEVFPNLIMNVTSDDKLTQQIHYIINRDLSGVFHLGSEDLIHHEDFIIEIVNRMEKFRPIYKRVYTTNDDRYLAVLPKYNLLPQNLHFNYQNIIDEHIFTE